MAGRGVGKGGWMRRVFPTAVVLAAALAAAVRAEDDADLRKQIETIKKDVEELRRERAATRPSPVLKSDTLLENKYGPNAAVSTKEGKLTVGGLLQVWFYSIQNDSLGWVDSDALHGQTWGSNETVDNDGYRIRRTRLMFTLDITENITAFVMINPAGEASSYPPLPSNQLHSGSVAYANAGFKGDQGIGSVRNAAVRDGTGSAGRDLEEAWIKYHGVVPHHEFQFGQIIRPIGEEGPRSSGLLDFVERAMINQNHSVMDIGGHVHGTWFDDRLQYWLGAYNGAGSAFQVRYNRADDNDAKDFLSRLLVRPVWKDEKWGSLELGYSLLYGVGGEAGGPQPDQPSVDGLNFPRTVHVNQHAWAAYFPGGPVKGWWLRGEWGQYRDRFRSGDVISDYPDLGSVTHPAPFSNDGWYFASGYKITDSIWNDEVPSWFKDVEFTFRYEVMRNLFFADLAHPERELDVFKTQVYTAGLNYYIKGHNAKIQINYNWVREEHPDSGLRQLREVDNDCLMTCFQVMW
jgi:hypothetical protein